MLSTLFLSYWVLGSIATYKTLEFNPSGEYHLLGYDVSDSEVGKVAVKSLAYVTIPLILPYVGAGIGFLWATGFVKYENKKENGAMTWSFVSILDSFSFPKSPKT